MDSRAAFEAWAEKQSDWCYVDVDTKDEHGAYLDFNTDWAWHAWQARDAEVEALHSALAESRADDRCAMNYLQQIRNLVGGRDFPEMIERIAALAAGVRGPA